MDRRWIKNQNKLSDEYKSGVESFLEVARRHVNAASQTLCPCIKCLNVLWQTIPNVRLHLRSNGISQSYEIWTSHGEKVRRQSNIPSSSMTPDVNDAVYNILNDAFPTTDMDHMSQELGDDESLEGDEGVIGDGHADVDTYEKLIAEAQREFFPGCDGHSVLTAMVNLMHIKVLNHWTNKSFDMLLERMKALSPKPNNIPSSFYTANKMLKGLGLGYEKIDACKYDCALFYKEHAHKEFCPECGEPRYKAKGSGKNKIPQKVLRYFPLTPRLKRLYMSNHTATNMRWHHDKRVDEEGYMRHPADSPAWKDFDKKNPEFALEPRNVRLGLATDGFNPFGNMSLSYSMWPVMVFPYNLPPWMCMKKQFLMMTLLIPGPQAPSKDLDVYLRPLIDELKELWELGVPTYDKSTNSSFNLHAAVLWTINDFPAYGNLSGWSTKGFKACPVCNKDSSSYGLRSKVCYMGHRRFLRMNHPWRLNKEMFNNEEELRPAPKELSGDDILGQVDRLRPCKPGKNDNNPDKKRKRLDFELNWTKKSIFFELEYWSKLRIRHNLDVMHIQKNICDSVVGTVLAIPGKSKDTVKARLDLEDYGIRQELHIEEHGSDFRKPHARFTVVPQLRKFFWEWMKGVKLPDGYASNISRCVKDGKFSGLKSHDCQVLLQRLLPVGIRPYLIKEVCDVIVELSCFFQQLCAKTLVVADVKKLQKNIVLILCKLEQIFPPAFFDVMVHLAVHLPREALLGGPVAMRWMFPIERKLGNLKGFVRNQAHPEGYIAEGYIVEEALTFCSMYLDDVETVSTRPERNYDGGGTGATLSVFNYSARMLQGHESTKWLDTQMEPAYWYILDNCDEVEPFKVEHKQILESESRFEVEGRHRKSFPKWFKSRIKSLRDAGSSEVNDELYALSFGPHNIVSTYTSCIVSGIRWHVKKVEESRTVQNSGIMVPGFHGDKESDFYGSLISIVKIDFIKGYSAILFEGAWYDTRPKKRKRQASGGIVRDYHLILVDTNAQWYNRDPYILATQAQQIFYLDDPKLGHGWRVIQKIRHRHVWDVPENEEAHDAELNYNSGAYEEDEVNDTIIDVQDHNPYSNTPLSRDDVEPETVILDPKDIEARRLDADDDFIDDDYIEDLVSENDEYNEDSDDSSDDSSDLE